MPKKELYIPNISCQHCIMSIKGGLQELEGVTKVEGETNEKKVIVEYTQDSILTKIVNKLREINYPPEE